MDIVEQTHYMFIAAIIIGTLLCFYLAAASVRFRKDDALYQLAGAWVVKMTKTNYSKDYSHLLTNLQRDLQRGYAYPVRRLAAISNRWFKANPRTNVMLNGQEQAKVITWLLDFEKYPEAWKVAKIRHPRSMSELIELATAYRNKPMNDVMFVLTN